MATAENDPAAPSSRGVPAAAGDLLMDARRPGLEAHVRIELRRADARRAVMFGRMPGEPDADDVPSLGRRRGRRTAGIRRYPGPARRHCLPSGYRPGSRPSAQIRSRPCQTPPGCGFLSLCFPIPCKYRQGGRVNTAPLPCHRRRQARFPRALPATFTQAQTERPATLFGVREALLSCVLIVPPGGHSAAQTTLPSVSMICHWPSRRTYARPLSSSK